MFCGSGDHVAGSVNKPRLAGWIMRGHTAQLPARSRVTWLTAGICLELTGANVLQRPTQIMSQILFLKLLSLAWSVIQQSITTLDLARAS